MTAEVVAKLKVAPIAAPSAYGRTTSSTMVPVGPAFVMKFLYTRLLIGFSAEPGMASSAFRVQFCWSFSRTLAALT